jgi:hypothetical protein
VSSARCCHGLLQIHLTGVIVNSTQLTKGLDVLSELAVAAVVEQVKRLTEETSLGDRFIDLSDGKEDWHLGLEEESDDVTAINTQEAIVNSITGEHTVPLTVLTMDKVIGALIELERIEPRKLKLRLAEGVNEYA